VEEITLNVENVAKRKVARTKCHEKFLATLRHLVRTTFFFLAVCDI